MEDKVICPRCKSDQIIANQKGFSGGKAIVGAVLTGGVGLLAGFHNSRDIIVSCLKCGNSWNPKKVEEQNKRINENKEDARVFLEKDNWERRIIKLYEANNFQKAESVFLSKYKFNSKNPDIHSVYKYVRKKRITNIIYVAIFVFLLAFFVFIIFM